MSKYFNILYYRNINQEEQCFGSHSGQTWTHLKNSVQILKNSVDNPGAMIWRPRKERNRSDKLVLVLWGLSVAF